MAAPATLLIRINGDASKARQAMGSVESGMSKMARVAGGIGTALAGAFAVDSVLTFAQESMTAASNVQQSMGAVESVFGKAAQAVKGYADTSAETVGLSKNAYAELASVLGAQLKNMGTPMGELSTQTNDLVTLGADLAATFGGPTSQAVEALGSLLRGERDPIERYGVSISQAAVNAKISALGLDTSTAAAQRNANAQATLALLAEQTADATGQFARESGSAAGAQQIANANWENAQAVLGQRLLPAMTAVSEFVSGTLVPGLIAVGSAVGSFVSWITGTSTAAQILVPIIGGLTAAFAAYLIVIGAVRVATAIWTGIQLAWNIVMAANPLALIILGIVALVAAIVIAYKRSETFRNIVDAAFSAIGTAISTVVDGVVAAFEWCRDKAVDAWETLTGAIDTAVSGITGFFDGLIDKIEAVIGWFQSIKVPDWLSSAGDWIGDLFSSPVPPVQVPVSYMATDALPGAGGLRAFAAGPSFRLSGSALAAISRPVVRVYIGETELTGIVRTEVRAEGHALARRITGRATR
ncbi:hypothetical protein [Phytomonospora endophytica]|uniref:Phage-related protein n=1 Tax=Phytomonospora endophytica TaxID=714109 RepID=A0A841FQA7_9ACTN|nr:hypothetical protein [Phytomonospora endophytica]MBB6038325.1 phage-related protein [Phytomonospora endophytica]GIG64256.1 hypothetical protein Pen01_05510 [Phytomonospora endophytica]